ncbi:MAG: leucine-rich repeat domain-containing protein, partial [Clostridia bacterium]|nr:leucine-rich repeat domain-containing protein [Clostridia bacterium]
MKIKTKILFTLIGALLIAGFFALSAFATLADQKPTTEPTYSGYVVNGRDGHTIAEGLTDAKCTGDYTTHAPTNIKWELFNEGTEEAPEYSLYFSIDNEGYAKKYAEKYPDLTTLPYDGNTILYAYTYLGNSTPHGNGWTETSDKYVKHPWFAETGIATEDITKIIIGDGITELKDGTFSNMRGVTVIEMPTSLTSFNGTPFKGCVALSTVYTRGQEPVEGTFDLSYIKNFASFNYTFSCCQAVKQYVFAEDAYMGDLTWANFYKNSSLESITLPEGVTKLNADSFSECTSLKSIVLPSTLATVGYRSFHNCTSLTEITFNSDATIAYNSDAVSKADVISEVKDAEGKNYLNAFVNCSALKTINAPKGSPAYEFALKFTFMTLADLKPSGKALDSGYVVNGREGHTGTETACTGDYTTHAPTNIKWELFNEGTEEAPEYSLYFSIDNEGYAEKYAVDYPALPYKGNTILYAYTYLGNNKPHGNGWEERDDRYVKHPWFADTGIATEDITKIVIGDGITELKDGTFTNMRGVTVIEMPTSLTSFNGTPFKGCVALSKVYTRGQSPVEGTFNLGYIKNFARINYTFSYCQAVKQYIFAEDAYMDGLSHGNFSNNTSLETINLPEGIDRIGTACFSNCTSLKSVILPSSITLLNKNSFTGCTALTEITFSSDATIPYDSSATDKSGVIANQSDNAFINCTALTTINAPIGSGPHAFALTFGFETSHCTELYDESGNHLCTMTYYPDDFHMTIESHYQDWWEWTPATKEIRTFINAYKNVAESVVFTGYFGKIHTAAKVEGDVVTAFSGWDKLQSIRFPRDARLLDYESCGAAFSGCEA